MSNPETRFVEDIKVANDVEQGTPPSYPLNESEELVVGGPKPRCNGWRIFRRHRRHGCCRHSENIEGRKKRSKLFRVVKFLLASWLLLSLVHFVVVGVKFHKAFKTLKCTTITPANASSGIEYTLPLAHISSSVFVHSSLSAADSIITHDSSVANGTVHVAVKFSDDTKQDEVFDGCVVQLKHGTGVALIPRERHGQHAQIASFSLRFPTSVTAPAVQFIGEGNKHISDKKLRKVIRWWRKHHEKKDANLVDDE